MTCRIRYLIAIVVLAAALFARGAAVELLHLPGVGGHLRIDDNLIEGLRQGGIDGQATILDWTCADPGLAALAAYDRNQIQAGLVADRISKLLRNNDAPRLMVTAHSGGCAMAAWALERLGDGVQVDSLLMVQPALSPQYDLSRALRHVRGHVYVFVSPYDGVLDWGTRTFGTMDRVKSVSAGLVGFTAPPGADPDQYAKIVQIPYDPAWMRLGYAGDHAGSMTPLFARTIFAPLLQTGKLPKLPPATQPTSQPGVR